MIAYDKVFMFFLFVCMVAAIVIVIIVNFFPCSCERMIESALQGCICYG